MNNRKFNAEALTSYLGKEVFIEYGNKKFTKRFVGILVLVNHEGERIMVSGDGEDKVFLADYYTIKSMRIIEDGINITSKIYIEEFAIDGHHVGFATKTLRNDDFDRFTYLVDAMKIADHIWPKTNPSAIPTLIVTKNKTERIDKSNNTRIPQIRTDVSIKNYRGYAICDSDNYDERQGILEAIANAVCGGNFEKEYQKYLKINKNADESRRTCQYCGKVFDSKEEKITHEKWHVENKKAKHMRYLARKEAKKRLAEKNFENLVNNEIVKINSKKVIDSAEEEK